MTVAVWPTGLRSSENPYIVVDARNGAILMENRPNDRWYPASLTKLMSAYVAFRAISRGELAEGSPVVISKAATLQPPSKMGYKKGVTLRLDTALKIIIIKSANDVSLALAEAVSGSLKNFVAQMNAEAKRLGMRNTRFANSNGLHNKGQYSSARDMAILSSRIITEFPQYAYMFQAVGIKTPARTHYSYNLLLERFSGTTGMKTGFVCASGYNMVASAIRGNRHLVAVVLGRSSQTDRAVSAARLISVAATKTTSGSLSEQGGRGADPRNMRPVLCTQEARAARYDPAAGNAVIESPFLQRRIRSDRILQISTGGVDASPGQAWISRNLAPAGPAPVPVKRPEYDRDLGRIVLAAIGSRQTGKIPVPTPRPR